MTTHRELLDLAAKAVGITIRWERDRNGSMQACQQSHGYYGVWRPLHDDGDAFRLAVSLKLLDGGYEKAITSDDPCAAVRRAIVKAAAEIGRRMPV
jgi:hypothetical protein